jgi:hypothetical protein
MLSMIIRLGANEVEADGPARRGQVSSADLVPKVPLGAPDLRPDGVKAISADAGRADNFRPRQKSQQHHGSHT